MRFALAHLIQSLAAHYGFDVEKPYEKLRKQHREVLEGDLIHLRRADARDLDYWLMVNPFAEERGALLVFNPLEVQRKMKIKVPLYYTGLDEHVSIWSEGTQLDQARLNRSYEIELEVDVPPGGFNAYFFKESK